MAQAVEDECPVAFQLGGIRNGIGEGVWVENSLVPLENPMRLKSKGPKHRIVDTKVPKTQQGSIKDNTNRERAERFVACAVTDVRLRLGMAILLVVFRWA
jgi:hypothetical protein